MYVDTATFTYNPLRNTLTLGSNGVGRVEATASMAATASMVRTGQNSTNAPFYPIYVANNAPTDWQQPLTDGGLAYNPSTNILSTTVTTAQQVNTVTISTNALHYPTFVDADNGSATAESIYTDAGISYNPSTNELRAGIVNLQSAHSVQYTVDANLTVDSALTQSVYWVASFTANRRLIINNMTTGRSIRVYIRNTNATARNITFEGSTTTSGHGGLNMAVAAGAASALTQSFAANNGTGMAMIENIGGFIVGGIM